MENSEEKSDDKTSENEQKISVCDIMKNNTSTIIKKLESQIPATIQAYSDFYTSYLHSLDDVFGTCYIAEKQVFDKMGFDEKFLKNFKEASDNFTKNIEYQIEIMNSWQKSFIEMRTQWMKMYEQYVHIMMDSYARFLSQLNANIQKQT